MQWPNNDLKEEFESLFFKSSRWMDGTPPLSVKENMQDIEIFYFFEPFEEISFCNVHVLFCTMCEILLYPWYSMTIFWSLSILGWYSRYSQLSKNFTNFYNIEFRIAGVHLFIRYLVQANLSLNLHHMLELGLNYAVKTLKLKLRTTILYTKYQTKRRTRQIQNPSFNKFKKNWFTL